MIISKEPFDAIYSTLITGTGAHTGTWNEILILEANTTFTTLTDANRDGDVIANTDTFPAGAVVHGAFTAITLNSGSVIAYYK